MGNRYSAPPKEGTYPFTRSGIAPPATEKKSGSDQPAHRIHDPMSLEMHMADQRVRTAGMSDAEREWRSKWIHDQHLHPDEPIHVDAVHRQLNPVRILYRYPLDTLYKRFLQPTFGVYYGAAIRVFVPKLLFALITFQVIYYHLKYNSKSWQTIRGVGTYALKPKVDDLLELKKQHPELVDKGYIDPAKYRYFVPSWDKRTSNFELGQSNRPF